MAHNFMVLGRSRPISISIPGYDPRKELKKIDQRMERKRERRKREEKAAAQQRRLEELRKRLEEERQLEELNMELSTRCSEPLIVQPGEQPCNLFQSAA